MIPTQYSKPINKIGSHLAVKENAMIPLKCLGFSMLTMAFLCLFFIRGAMPYIWFYTLGFLVMKYDLGKYINVRIAAISFIVFALCSHFFVHNSINTQSWQIWLQMFLSLLVIVFCFHSFRNMDPEKLIIKKLSVIGKYTLGIYLAHGYFLDIHFIEINFSSLSCSMLLVIFTLLGIIISCLCICIEKFLECNSVLGFLFYGKSALKTV